jgi:cystathionine beta-lyase/cystathionine gamma-synthase
MTKYLNGHSDVIGGCLVVKDDELRQRLAFLQNAVGAIAGPFDSYLALRGVKTLAVRMQRHCENAQRLAEWLQAHPRVARVHYPGLASHPLDRLRREAPRRQLFLVCLRFGLARQRAHLPAATARAARVLWGPVSRSRAGRSRP